ncbi:MULTISPECIES: MFS transporter [unclassified Pseudomonas]|uniref:MFS transporter n=1 Tax=unclassified Pseudomonas TaxID=196821 RepID=UPI000A1F64FF|nr:MULTISPECIES: MFS transporter [unclassified Pseudomonas]
MAISRGLVGVLLASSPAMALLYTVASPILPQMAAQLGGDPDDAILVAQLVMMVPSIGLMLGGPLMGWLVDRWGAPRLLWVACAGYALLGSGGLYLAEPWSLIGSRFLLGIMAAGLGTATLALTARYFEPQARSRLVGYQSACGALVGLMSMLAAGYLGQVFGWRIPFAFYLAALPLLVMALVFIPKTNQHAGEPAGSAGQTSLGSMVWLLLGIVPLFICVFTSSTQVSFLLAERGVVQPSVVAIVIAMSALFNTLGAAGYGRLSLRFGSPRMYLLALVSLAAGHVVVGMSAPTLVAALGCALTGYGSGLLLPYLVNLVLDRCEEAQRGRAVGLMYSCMFLGSFLNPLLLAPLAVYLGRGTAVIMIGLALLIYWVILLVLRVRPTAQRCASAE